MFRSRVVVTALAIAAIAWFAYAWRPAQSRFPEPTSPPTWNELAASAVLAIKAGSLESAYRLHDEARALVTPPQPGDLRPAQTLVLLSEIHQSAGKTEEAETALRDAVAAGESAVGADDPRLLEVFEGRANFYFYREQLAEAIPIHRRMLQITERAFADSPREIANRARNLAALYEKLGRFDEAAPLYDQALAAGERAGPVFQTDLVQDILTVAEFQRQRGDLPEATSLATRAVKLAESTSGPDSMDTALALGTLAEIHLAAGDASAAAEPAQRSLRIAEQSLGRDSADLAPRLVTLAAVAVAKNDPAAADAHFTRALTLTESALGPTAPELAELLTRYAELLDATHRPADAEKRRQQADLILNPPIHEPTLAEGFEQ
jgi:tetratricopeptide (TPR) repeat protein